MDPWADAIYDFGEAVDRAVETLRESCDISHKEIADQLRGLAQEWEDAA